MIGPNDLVALVSFDGRVYENEAVTREHLGRPAEAPHPLGAALQHWLLRRNHMWMEVAGRRIQGVATARQLAKPQAWEIDTLLDAPEHDEDDRAVGALLGQLIDSAVEHEVTHVLLRLPTESPAMHAAVQAGFTPAIKEQLWAGDLHPITPGPTGIEVRLATPDDAHARFLLYNRCTSVDTRQALAVTFEEWAATREEHWLRRNAKSFVAESDGRIVGSLDVAHGADASQFRLVHADEDTATATALLQTLAGHEPSGPVMALVPERSATLVGALAARGLEPLGSYTLLCRRTQSFIGEVERAGRRVPIPSGG